MKEPIIEIKNLVNRFGEHIVHDGISLTINRSEVIAIIGGSGSGKTTLLRTILMLNPASSGEISLFGSNIDELTDEQIKSVRRRIGVSFQYNALFSSLTILENIRFPLDEFTKLPKREKNRIALVKLRMVGLDPDIASCLPSELSGGMQKRVSVARALVLEPEILFLDEPTSGLDPINARKFDKLVQNLREMLGLTIVMVTHDVHSLPMANRVVFLGDARLVADMPYQDLLKVNDPLVRDYFSEELVSGE